MTKFLTLVLTASIAAALSGCANTSMNTASGSQKQAIHETDKVTSANQHAILKSQDKINAKAITLKQIMADPQWLGRAPRTMGWSVDGKHIVYEREQVDSDLSDVYVANVDAPKRSQKAELSALHKYRFDERVVRDDGVIAFRFKDSVYVQFTDDSLVQLSRGGSYLSTLSFMTDGRLMALMGDRFVAINLESGEREELLRWAFADKPTAVEPAKDYIAAQQQTLIQYIEKQREAKVARKRAREQLASSNSSLAPEPFYFDKTHKLAGVSVSPTGKLAIVATVADKPSRADSDIMPHYIQEDSRIVSKSVRRRVADATPVTHEIWLLDLVSGEQKQLNYFSLPGYNDDVLAHVKAENAKAVGEHYEVNRLPRSITLISGNNWRSPSIKWHRKGNQVALMLEAWDNKDRWIATVDFSQQRLVNQHRLHDDAWVNYRFNNFGWLNHQEVLYFQSEHTGYAHLYIQPLGQSPKALTQGNHITSNPTLTDDDEWMYYQANSKHPGVYDIYRVNVANGDIQALTNLQGITDYSLSPDGKLLLLSHSKIARPPELYVKAVDSGELATQITHTVTESFTSMPWAIPNLVAIPSSHTDAPIYARVYLPKNYDAGKPNKAVVFTHGAGYLQNAHYGWSGYFREYMFNSMLVQQGYVVLDMDYRASAGYGRDWRTAIYRQMGTPEVQDLRDGVNWLVEHANVDPSRIGTYGGSYGGFLTFMSMFTAPDLFAAGAALRPVTDWAHYNTGYTSNILNTPDVDPIAFERSSPIYFAEGLQKPLLINAPMVDDNVFFLDTVRLVQRLIELEKENFETAIYPVEPHGFVQPSSWLDEYRRIYKLFEQNL